jgi:hypothetical protein
VNTTERELLERCKEFIDAQWVDGAVDLSAAIEACLAKPVQEDQPQPDSLCQEDDGCPTEVAVLKRFWRCHQAKSVQEPSCNLHPNAPHGFSRNASHSANRYVCECEGWSEKETMQKEPVQEPVATVEHVFAGGTVLIDVKTNPPLKSFANGTKFYASPMSGALIVHKGCKTTWADGVIEIKPAPREPMSEKELDKLVFDCGLSATAKDIARAIEAYPGKSE